ncbi:MAG: amidohydrolase [Flavobacteriales bacterium]
MIFSLKKIGSVVLTAFALSSCHFGNVQADMIIHNATIYTMNEDNDIKDAMAIKDGIIVAIGPEREIMNEYDAPIIYDARKRAIYPGFIDGHCHFLAYGLMLHDANLVGAESFEEVVNRVVEYAPTRQSEWIIGRGWDQNDWQAQQFPSKDTLDILFPDTPVYLSRIDGHAILVNQKALELAGITGSTTISGGIIEKNDKGQLTGVLVDNAMNPVMSVMPERSREEKIKALIEAQQKCFEVGLTTLDEAGLDWRDIDLIDSLQQTGELKMRIYAMLSDNQENYDVYFERGIDTLNLMLNVRSFKFYADGALGSRGACLLNPYEDLLQKGNREYGMMLKDESYYLNRAQMLYEMGFQMNTHAIGDSANRVMLHIYKEVLEKDNNRRWRIEHAQVVDKNDLYIFKERNIIPSVQPTHATSDMPWAWLRLGKARMGRAYAYKELEAQNGMLALGTDFPVEGISPINTFYAAVVRKDKSGNPSDGFQVENALSRESALRGMTIWNAIANFEEQYKGSLEVGKVADIVILDRDLMKVGEDNILGSNVDLVVIGGVAVYERKNY